MKSGLFRYGWFSIYIFFHLRDPEHVLPTKGNHFANPFCKGKHGNSLTMHSDVAQHLLSSAEMKKILDPTEASGSCFLSKKNAITHHCSTQWVLITLLLCLLCNHSSPRSLFLLFCWVGGQTAESMTGSAGPFQEQVIISTCPSSNHPCEKGNGIAPTLQLGNLNIQWLVKSYTARLRQSMHSVSFLEIFDSTAKSHSFFLSESLKDLLLQFYLKSVVYTFYSNIHVPKPKASALDKQ